jgi:hypothetical protein
LPTAEISAVGNMQICALKRSLTNDGFKIPARHLANRFLVGTG